MARRLRAGRRRLVDPRAAAHVLRAEWVFKTTLWNTALKRHLTTFKTDTNSAASAGLLTFVTFTSLSTLTRTLTTADTLSILVSALWAFQCFKS